MSFTGGNFTWVSSMTSPNPIKIRLDRGLCNENWKYVHPDSFITYLPRINSDHNPLLLSLFTNHQLSPALKPFRFHLLWCDHPGFINPVKGTWEKHHSCLNSKLSEMVENLSNWNKQVFGDIFKQKKQLILRLNGIQWAQDREFNLFLHDLERELQFQLVEWRKILVAKMKN